jgi:hypothetical protein
MKFLKRKATTVRIEIARNDLIICHLNSSRCWRKDISPSLLPSPFLFLNAIFNDVVFKKSACKDDKSYYAKQ